MALAYLEALETTADSVELRAHTGANQFYEYRIGTSADGNAIDRVDFASALMQSPGGVLGSPFRIRVPASKFSRESRAIQLVSFRDALRNGPAVSRVLEVLISSIAADEEWSDVTSGQALLSVASSVRREIREVQPISSRGGARSNLARSKGVVGAAGVRLEFDPERSVTVGTRRVTAYSATNALSLSVCVVGLEASRVLARAILEVTIVEAADSGPGVTANARFEGVRDGQRLTVSLPADRLAALPRATALKCIASLRWREGTATATASSTRSIVLAGRFVGVEVGGPGGTVVRLDDVNRYRAFWNRVWMGELPSESDANRWETDLQCRFYIVHTAATGNARMDTKLVVEEQSKMSDLRFLTKGRIKSGLEVSTAALVALGVDLGETALDADEIATLAASRTVATVLPLQATGRIRAKGKRGTHLAVWAAPIMEMREFTFHAVDGTSDAGEIIATRPVRRTLPVPERIRFVSLRSASGNVSAAGFEGYEVIEDVDAALTPVALADVGREPGGVS